MSSFARCIPTSMQSKSSVCSVADLQRPTCMLQVSTVLDLSDDSSPEGVRPQKVTIKVEQANALKSSNKSNTCQASEDASAKV